MSNLCGRPSNRNVCLNEAGEWNNWEPVILDSMLISNRAVNYGVAVLIDQVLFNQTSNSYGITALKGHDEGYDQQPNGGYSVKDMACILRYGQIAVCLASGQATAGQKIRVDAEGFIHGNNTGNTDTYEISNIEFDSDGFQGDLVKVRVSKAQSPPRDHLILQFEDLGGFNYYQYLPPFGELSNDQIIESGNPIQAIIIGPDSDLGFAVTLQNPSSVTGQLFIGNYPIDLDFASTNSVQTQLTVEAQEYISGYVGKPLPLSFIPTP